MAEVLVAGGSGGLGRACCRLLARDGWEVHVGYHTGEEAAQAVSDGIREAGGVAVPKRLDLPDGDLGELRVDSVVWAVGADIGQPWVVDLDPRDLRRAVDVELHGFAAVLRATLPSLRTRGGSVVALTSAGNRRHPPGDILSTAPKAAVEAMVRAVAREEGRHGVRANAVAVGVADAGIFHRLDFDARWLDAARRRIPLRRFARADEIAEVVAFLAGPRASYVTGQTLHADGGYTV